MKVLGVLAAMLLLTGCGSIKSMDELQLEASITGDWSEVEKRERMIARRKEREGPTCPKGYVTFCEQSGGEKRCGCVSRQGVREVFAGR